MARETLFRPIRVNKELSDWFDSKFSWRGAFPGFVNDCLRELQQEWGDRASPNELVPEIVRRAKERLA